MRPTSAPTSIRGPPLSLCDIMQLGYIQQVRMLVDMGADVEVRDANGRTPLMLTAYVQPEEWGVGVARLLIESGVDMAARDRDGMNVLHHACVYERLQLAKVLLSSLDFDMTQSDKYGNTALHYAAAAGNLPLVQLLLDYLEHYRLPVDKINKQGRSPLDEAVRAGSALCAAILNDAIGRRHAIRNHDDSNNRVEAADACRAASRSVVKSCVIDAGTVPGEGAGEIRVEDDVFSDRIEVRPAPSPIQYLKSQNENVPPTRTRRSGVRRPHTAAMKRCPPTGSDVDRRSSGTTSRLRRTSSLLGLRGNVAETALVSFYEVKDVNAGDPSANSANIPGLSSRSRKSLQRERAVSARGVISPAGEKNLDLVIHVVPESDFRNAPEYVLKLTRMAPNPSSFDPDTLPSLVHKHQPLLAYQEPASKKLVPGTWRDEMQVLFRHYAMQCSPNWRNAAQPTLDGFSCAGNTEDGDDNGSKDRKFRRPLSNSRQSVVADISTSSMSVKRRPGSHKQRKISAASPPAGRPAGVSPDLATSEQVSSSESLASNTEGPKKKKDSAGARGELTPTAAGGDALSNASRNLAKMSVDSTSSGVLEVKDSTGGSGAPGRTDGGFANGVSAPSPSSAGGGRGEAGGRARRMGTVTSQGVPTLTETLIPDDVSAEVANSEPVEIDSSRLTVVSEGDN